MVLGKTSLTLPLLIGVMMLVLLTYISSQAQALPAFSEDSPGSTESYDTAWSYGTTGCYGTTGSYGFNSDSMLRKP
ncbi:hypothetical protein O3P69_004349 [Scylla paramamosain]|uniref:Uncharacterized protein n=1 Tax=Scylla paramamosain TaxID=85552 RepID=A0AAW0UCL1_SCYPA